MTTRYWPLDRGCIITSPFGWRAFDNAVHAGIDFGWPGGSANRPVYAVQAGTVIKAGAARGYGGPDPAGWLVIDSTDEQGAGCFEYGHIVREVGVGQTVAAGQRIGYVNPNKATNAGVDPHLHVSYMPREYNPGAKQDWRGLLDGAIYPGGTPAPNPGGGTVTGPVFGIDVSNHQREFNFAGAAAEGYRFATHKVTEGTDYRDPYWPRARAEMAKHFPGRFGGYVFCRTNTDPQREADVMMAALGDPSIPVQIDYEDTLNGGSGADLARRVQAYRDRGARLLPVYLPRWFWEGRMGRPDLSFIRDVGLWNSNYVNGTGYGSALYNPNSAGWQGFGGVDVRILQFTEQAQVAGQRIDANAVKDAAALNAIFGTNTGGFMPALNDDEQREMLGHLRWLRDQFGPNKWGPESSMGKNAKGEELTVRDGLAAMKRTVEGGK